MKTSTNYKGYSISYSIFGANTTVHQYGIPLKIFNALGEMKGKELAKKYIDSLYFFITDNNRVNSIVEQ